MPTTPSLSFLHSLSPFCVHRGILHDEALYSDPFTFRPERFLPPAAGGLGEMSSAPTVFGFGRRICPGMHLAESALWIYATSVFAVLDIAPVCDENSVPVMPRSEIGPGIIRWVVWYLRYNGFGLIVFGGLVVLRSHSCAISSLVWRYRWAW
jgi:hypothetical protein